MKGYKMTIKQETKSGVQITQVQTFPIKEPHGKLMGFARVCLNDALQLTGLRIYKGTHGLFVSYPNDTSHKGDDYKQVYYPVESELRSLIEVTILHDYERELGS